MCNISCYIYFYIDGKHEQIQIIDTAPWMEFPVMHQLYIRNSQIVIIVYDCTAKLWKESLTNKINHIQDIKGWYL